MEVQLKKYFSSALLGITLLSMPFAESVAESKFSESGLNTDPKSVTTPVAWGASGNVVFMGVGGTVPAPYSTLPDGAAIIGYGFGNPKKNLGIQLAITSLDLSHWGVYAFGFKLHRKITDTSAIAAGGQHIMLTTGGDAGQSYYVVYSKGFPSDSDVHFSLGAGTGRYSDKSPLDIFTGKGAHGTYAFSNVSYGIANLCNVIVDWNGLNLNAGVGKTFKILTVPLATIVGLADLTDNSGDRVRVVVGVGTAFKL